MFQVTRSPQTQRSTLCLGTLSNWLTRVYSVPWWNNHLWNDKRNNRSCRSSIPPQKDYYSIVMIENNSWKEDLEASSWGFLQRTFSLVMCVSRTDHVVPPLCTWQVATVFWSDDRRSLILSEDGEQGTRRLRRGDLPLRRRPELYVIVQGEWACRERSAWKVSYCKDSKESKISFCDCATLDSQLRIVQSMDECIL